MNCPRCGSTEILKNGHRRGKQNYRCKNCDRQFIETYTQKGYSDDVKQLCLKMYQNGLGAREIERFTGIRHSTIHNWVRQSIGRSRKEVDAETRRRGKCYEL